jgi:hypothetical protein
LAPPPANRRKAEQPPRGAKWLDKSNVNFLEDYMKDFLALHLIIYILIIVGVVLSIFLTLTQNSLWSAIAGTIVP